MKLKDIKKKAGKKHSERLRLEKKIKKNHEKIMAANNVALSQEVSLEPAKQAISQGESYAKLRESTVKILMDATEAAAIYLGSVIINEKLSPKIRVEASKIVLDRMGFSPKDASRVLGSGLDKPLAEMTINELEEFIKERGAAMNAMRVIEGEIVDSMQDSVQEDDGAEDNPQGGGSS